MGIKPIVITLSFLLILYAPFSFCQKFEDIKTAPYVKGAFVSLSCPPIYSESIINIDIKSGEKIIGQCQSKEPFDFSFNYSYGFSIKISDSIPKSELLNKGTILISEFVDTNKIKIFGYINQWCTYDLYIDFSDGSKVRYIQNYIVSYQKQWTQKISELENVLDKDFDDVDDNEENQLANKFAPIVYHSFDEVNLPTNVDVFLKNTSLYIYDDKCDFPKNDINLLIKNSPKQSDLLNQHFDDNFCGSTGLVKSDCTKSVQKQRTYYLKDVDQSLRVGSKTTSDWTTYFHAYKNIYSGVTIQYWQLYAFNTGFKKWEFDFSHGGDWEGVQVVLDKNNSPLYVDFLGHKSIERFLWTIVKNDNNHPLIYSELGGHTSIPLTDQTGIKQETWTNGKVFHQDGTFSEGGSLLNVGEKIHPLNGQIFIQYSGLWGSPGDFYFTSGYWGPSYNETGLNTKTQFITAWCNDMLNAENKIENGVKECFPCGTSR